MKIPSSFELYETAGPNPEPHLPLSTNAHACPLQDAHPTQRLRKGRSSQLETPLPPTTTAQDKYERLIFLEHSKPPFKAQG